MLVLSAFLVDAPTVLVAATPAIGGVFANAWHGCWVWLLVGIASGVAVPLAPAALKAARATGAA
ncbi:hypothetical protein ACQPZF_26805 [Actinosynnema sp. CS-041913]|uniref:hypothetical protein n=1 Tax=Actinosynnema sp. CS-041913 TaxID=3239917 RepID=UPI003D8D6230